MQEYVYKMFYSYFLKVCARYAKSMQDAEQLINDGFLKIFTNIDKYVANGSFVAWMKRIMINTCLDYLRSSYVKEEMTLHSHAIVPEDTDLAVNNAAIAQIEFRELVNTIQNLPAMTRTVFNLFVFEGYNHKEIADQLQISEGTSHWHVHQARQLLQKKILKQEKQKAGL